MKIIASILCIYLFCLQLQPVLFPVKAGLNKAKSCCAKTDHKSNNDDCCDKGMCNPFFSTCLICAANGMPVQGFALHPCKVFCFISPVFFPKNSSILDRYRADIFRPPQAV